MAVNKEKIIAFLKEAVAFRNLPDNYVHWMMERGQLLEYQADQLLYETGAPAGKVFLLVSGRVSLFVADEERNYLVNEYQVGDLFGYEVLARDEKRCTHAKAQGRVMVLAIPVKVIQRIVQEFPAVSTDFELQLQSLEFLLKKPMDWLQVDEVVHYVGREHLLILAMRALQPILGALAILVLAIVFMNAGVLPLMAALWIGSIAGVLGIGWGMWNAIDWMNDFCVITNQRVVFLEKIALLYDSRKETPLSAILSITKQAPLLGRIYHYGDVVMRTFTGLVKFRNVAHVEAVSAIVEKQWLKFKAQVAAEEDIDPEEYLRKQFQRKMGLEREDMMSTEKSLPVENPIAEEYHADLLSRLLRLRIVEDGTIQYRTHWFVFIRKTIIPLLGILTSIIFYLAPQRGWFGMVPEGTETFKAVLVGLGVVMSIWWLYATIDWRNDYFLITPEQIVDIYRKPLGVDEQRSAPIRNIQTIEYKRKNVFGLLFNFGTVFIRVGDVEFTFDYVPQPSSVQQEIFHRFQYLKQKDSKENASMNNERLAKWMDAYHRVTQGEEDQEEGQDDL